ncbi:MAG: Gfo/Idh/MocA family oxidoreductase [Phycisphaerae bacterium]|nr:Gfo/Idh/MocA family oxidoreductase [Phycisphaerae bacterium]
MNERTRTSLSRRNFLAASASAFAFSIVPSHVLGADAPSNKVNLAGVGVGGMGRGYLEGCSSENVIALCDVDANYAAGTFKQYPKAKIYTDYRRMLDAEPGIDGVVIGTPDHTHAVIALQAMKMGKHVYCAKPLTRTVYESHLLRETARETGVATQMSVQSDANESQRMLCEWIWGGAIGKVREVHVWSDRPIWPQGLDRPKDTPAVPKGLDWDLWLGPAPHRPYHPIYVPFKWRGWWDFGTGALGDMGCHAFAHIAKVLKLGHPTAVHASSSKLFKETAPAASIVHWDFPARGDMPAVRVNWYDGGLRPERPAGLEDNRQLGSEGLIWIGGEGAIVGGFTGGGSRLIPERRMKDFSPPPKSLARSIGHYKEWCQACKGGPAAGCSFEFGGLLTQVVLLGNIAIRRQHNLLWDGEHMRFTNDDEANELLHAPYRDGWTL